MSTIPTLAHRIEDSIARRLAPHQERLTAITVNLLRFSLGFVFLLFGLLKLVPGLSPAEDIATATFIELTFGLVPEELALILVALLETAIGLTLLTGRYLKLGLTLLGVAMVGVLSPLVLFPAQLFAGPFFAPTLEGQYVIKDVILLAAGLVVAVRELARRPAAQPVVPRPQPATSPRPAVRLDVDRRPAAPGRAA